jgi:hypothetical protein
MSSSLAVKSQPCNKAADSGRSGRSSGKCPMKTPARQPVLTQEQPDVLHRVQLRCLGGQRHQPDVTRDYQSLQKKPARLVQQNKTNFEI